MRIHEIPVESELEKIDKYAFQESSIKWFTIPSRLKYIAETVFCCDNDYEMKNPNYIQK